jgi:aconitate hydratase
MIGAGLLAKKAVEKGLSVKTLYVKTSLAPGSRVVTDYLEKAGLLDPLAQLGFRPGRLRLHDLHRQLGPAARAGGRRHQRRQLVTAASCFPATATLKGASARTPWPTTWPRRRWWWPMPWPARRHQPGQRPARHRQRWAARLPARYLADFAKKFMETILTNVTARNVQGTTTPRLRRQRDLEPDPQRRQPALPVGARFNLHPGTALLSRHDQPPPALARSAMRARAGRAGRLGHHRPHLAAGAIQVKSPAGQYLIEQGVQVPDFNQYGSRRGNDRVMTRGTFANIRLKNLMVPAWRAASPSPAHRRADDHL